MASRKRSSSGSKRQLKEKVVQIYESLFKGEDLSRVNPNFWDELFLLKPKPNLLEAEITRLTNEQLIAAKENINLLFEKCVETLVHEHLLRVVYSLQTLCGLFSAIYKTSGQCHAEVIDVLMGFERAENTMKELIENCNSILTGDTAPNLRSLCLKLLLLMVTGNENVSGNTLLEYVMHNSVFETLIQLLIDSHSRMEHGHDVVLLITLLVNYRKYESANPYIVKLSILDDELALNGYGQVISLSLAEFCKAYSEEAREPQGSSWLSSLSNIVGSMFVTEDTGGKIQQIRANNGVLVALYEAVHLNRNFVSTLAHTQTDVSTQVDAEVVSEPVNLLGTFFQYCSIVMQDTKCESSFNTVKLCFFVLTCVAEDHYANSVMHDINLVFKIQLHRLPMRHRQLPVEMPSQTLANTLLDLLVEFVMSHMMKKLPLELYLLCIGVLHRVLCYQKRCRVRLVYQWKELWKALIALLKFIIANEGQLAKKMNVFLLAHQVINIFNLFITYGDTFLFSPAKYDELYYELIRVHQVFDNVYTMAFRYSAIESDFKETALRLTNSLVNVRAIINHFTPKIDAWLAGQGLSTPSEDQILDVVRKNYDSLTLKLQDSLDQYERYTENPRHSAFFTAMVRNVVTDLKQTIDFNSLDLQSVLQEFSTIT